MTWLIAHIWVSLSAAAVAALLLGWSLRGALLKGRVRRAEVERDVLRVELQEAREEVEKLFEAQRKQAAQAPAGEGGAPAAGVRDLQVRIAQLETELATAGQGASGVEAAAPPVPDAKLTWQASYLRQRVRALENELAAPGVRAQEAAEPDLLQEEVARLRWRNRYLEGRLAYFEGDAANLAQEAGQEMGEAVSEAADDPSEMAADPEPGLTDPAGGDMAGMSSQSPSVALEPVRPLALDRAVDGAPDDLTLVGGIGPKIAEVLNGLGIFHFDQIADWTPENVAWVDQYLNFNGRISREGWVEQAAILVGEAAEE